jgi:hypothetical protein
MYLFLLCQCINELDKLISNTHTEIETTSALYYSLIRLSLCKRVVLYFSIYDDRFIDQGYIAHGVDIGLLRLAL